MSTPPIAPIQTFDLSLKEEQQPIEGSPENGTRILDVACSNLGDFFFRLQRQPSKVRGAITSFLSIEDLLRIEKCSSACWRIAHEALAKKCLLKTFPSFTLDDSVTLTDEFAQKLLSCCKTLLQDEKLSWRILGQKLFICILKGTTAPCYREESRLKQVEIALECLEIIGKPSEFLDKKLAEFAEYFLQNNDWTKALKAAHCLFDPIQKAHWLQVVYRESSVSKESLRNQIASGMGNLGRLPIDLVRKILQPLPLNSLQAVSQCSQTCRRISLWIAASSSLPPVSAIDYYLRCSSHKKEKQQIVQAICTTLQRREEKITGPLRKALLIAYRAIGSNPYLYTNGNYQLRELLSNSLFESYPIEEDLFGKSSLFFCFRKKEWDLALYILQTRRQSFPEIDESIDEFLGMVIDGLVEDKRWEKAKEVVQSLSSQKESWLQMVEEAKQSALIPRRENALLCEWEEGTGDLGARLPFSVGLQILRLLPMKSLFALSHSSHACEHLAHWIASQSAHPPIQLRTNFLLSAEEGPQRERVFLSLCRELLSVVTIKGEVTTDKNIRELCRIYSSTVKALVMIRDADRVLFITKLLLQFEDEEEGAVSYDLSLHKSKRNSMKK